MRPKFHMVEWFEARKTGHGSSTEGSKLRWKEFETKAEANRFAHSLRSDCWVEISCVTVDNELIER